MSANKPCTSEALVGRSWLDGAVLVSKEFDLCADRNLGSGLPVKAKHSMLHGRSGGGNFGQQLRTRSIWQDGTHKERTQLLVIRTGPRTRECLVQCQQLFIADVEVGQNEWMSVFQFALLNACDVKSHRRMF